MFEERALDTGLHDRRGFDCGVDALNDYLQRYADQHRRRGVSSVFVLTDSEDPARILGYYTLSAAEVESNVLSTIEQKRLPRYPIPCFRLGYRSTGAGPRTGALATWLRGGSLPEGLGASGRLCVGGGRQGRRCATVLSASWLHRFFRFTHELVPSFERFFFLIKGSITCRQQIFCLL